MSFRLGRQRQRERLDDIRASLGLQFFQDAIGVALEFPQPGLLHDARRHRGEHLRALRHVRLAVLAHHVVAHQHIHQSARLMRGENVDALFLGVDIVAAREHGRVELRHKGDRRLLPHPRKIRIGIGPEGGNIDVVVWCVGHCYGSNLNSAGFNSSLRAKRSNPWCRKRRNGLLRRFRSSQ